MWGNSFSNPSSRLSFWVGIGGVGVGVVAGVLAGTHPSYLCLALGAVAIAVYFFTNFEQAVLGLLILRSSLDIFSAQQVPAAFAIGLDVLTLLYIALMLLTGRRIQTDKFWWFFASWVGVQGLWVVLMFLGGLGLDASYLPDSIREWVRLFSWLMVYLLVMQLKGKISPERFIGALMLGLITPLTVAVIQVLVPPSMLPPLLVYRAEADSLSLAGSRIFGTLGHPNGFAKFLFLFIALTWWQLDRSRQRRLWMLLLCLLIFFLVTTKSLFAIGMLGVFVLALTIQRLTIPRLIGGGLLFLLFIGLFASTEFGLERLSSITNTPLLNPDIDTSRAILMSEGNSFNWRIAQWTYLLEAWQEQPVFGYGLQASPALTVLNNYAHNDYIRALVEGGIIGFLTFIGFLGGQLLRLIQLYKQASSGSAQRSLCSVLLAIFLSLILGMSTDNVWSNTVFYFYWWSILAVAGWNWNQDNKSKAPNFF